MSELIYYRFLIHPTVFWMPGIFRKIVSEQSNPSPNRACPNPRDSARCRTKIWFPIRSRVLNQNFWTFGAIFNLNQDLAKGEFADERRREQSEKGIAEQREQVLALHLSAGWERAQVVRGVGRCRASNSTAFTHSKQRTRDPKTRRGRGRDEWNLADRRRCWTQEREKERKSEKGTGPEQLPHLLILVRWLTTIRSCRVRRRDERRRSESVAMALTRNLSAASVAEFADFLAGNLFPPNLGLCTFRGKVTSFPFICEAFLWGALNRRESLKLFSRVWTISDKVSRFPRFLETSRILLVFSKKWRRDWNAKVLRVDGEIEDL